MYLMILMCIIVVIFLWGWRLVFLCFWFMPSPTIAGGDHYVLGSSVRPSVRPLTPILRDGTFSVTGRNSMKLATNIQHVSAHCWKGLEGQSSKVKVSTRSNTLFRERDSRKLAAIRPLCMRRRHTACLTTSFWLICCRPFDASWNNICSSSPTQRLYCNVE